MVSQGVLLAGGSGTRLFPLTKSYNKHLLPIFDKPMIYYSLSILILSGIRKVALVTNEKYISQFKNLLGDGSEFGIEIKFVVQENPEGIPDAINLGYKNLSEGDFMVVLGDNFIYGREFFREVQEQLNSSEICIFTQKVKNPEDFGVAIIDKKTGVFQDIVEKPNNYISNEAVIGIYKFDSTFPEKFKNIEKSTRGEYEIGDIVKLYDSDKVNVVPIGRGSAWFDMGSFESFYNCSSFVKTIQDRQGLLVCSPHEASTQLGLVSIEQLSNYIKENKNSEYASSLKYLLN